MRTSIVPVARNTLLALLVASCGSSCSGPRDAPGIVLDLAAAAVAADLQAPWDVVRFGTPSASPFLERGFVEEPQGPPFPEPHAVAKPQPTVRLSWDKKAPRLAVIDLAAYDGLTSQTTNVFLNEHPVGLLQVSVDRRRYRVVLPEESQKRGMNRLRFEFSRATNGASEDSPRSARFYGLAVGEATDAALEGLLAEGAPPPLTESRAGHVPSLVQAGPTSVRYALRLPAEAELRFEPGPRASGGPALFRVTFETEGSPERTLWALRVDPGRPVAEVVVPLRGPPGALVRVGLEVAALQGVATPWGVWLAPRIVGRGPADLLRELSSPVVNEDRGASLGKRLSGSNVLVLLLDAAGAHHFGAYGYPRLTTPEIDRIAAEGVVFERAYTPVMFTSSAVSSIFTSQYPDEHHNGLPANAPLPSDRLTLAEVLRGQGIHTAAFVANSNAGPANAVERGFVEFDETYRRHGGGAYDPLKARTLRETVAPWLRARKGQKPFFAYVHFREPHFPYDPPAPFTTLFGPDAPLGETPRRHLGWINAVNAGQVSPREEEIQHLVRLYDGNLAYGDQEIGQLRKALEEAGLWEDTVVVVIADHGEALTEHGFIGHNDQVYEESVRIPLIIRFPAGKGPSGVRVKGLVDLLDIAPTVADIFGVRGAAGSDREFHGRSLLSAALGGPGKPAVISRTAWRRVQYAVGDGRYKMIYDVPNGSQELFELDTDPEERTDRTAQFPLRAAYYRQALHRWQLEVSRGRRGQATDTVLTPEQIDNLKALGYVQ